MTTSWYLVLYNRMRELLILLLSSVCQLRVFSISVTLLVVPYSLRTYLAAALWTPYLITKFILPWVPYRGAVFKPRTNISVVSCFFNFLIICLYISFDKFQGVVCFRGHIFNVGFPIKVITNGDSKVFSIFG